MTQTGVHLMDAGQIGADGGNAAQPAGTTLSHAGRAAHGGARSLYAAVHGDVQGEGAALAKARQHDVLAAAHRLRFFFDEVAHHLR